jgi:hypothetical protein
MSLKNIKQQSDIKLLNENLFEKNNISNTTKIISKKSIEEKQRNCVSIYLTDSEYELLKKIKGDVAQSLFCRKIILEKIYSV